MYGEVVVPIPTASASIRPVMESQTCRMVLLSNRLVAQVKRAGRWVTVTVVPS